MPHSATILIVDDQPSAREVLEELLADQIIMTAASTLTIQDILHLACKSLAQACELPQASALLLNEERTQFVAMVDYRVPAVDLGGAPSNQALRAQPDQSLNEAIPFAGLLSEYLSEHKIPVAIAGIQTTPPLAQVYHERCHERCKYYSHCRRPSKRS
jgi:CheY-like chemotaxis protein